jgi:hypothetical protein
MMATAGKNARIRVMSDAAPVTFTNEATTANATRTEYKITNPVKKYWDKGTPVVVTVTPASTISRWVRHAGGVVVFDQPLDVGATVTVSGAYVTTALAAEVSEYNVTLANPTTDVSVLEVEGRRKISTYTDATGTITGFYNVDNLLQDKILEAKPVIIEMDFDSTNEDGEVFAVYARLNSHEVSSAVDGAVGATVGWESDGAITMDAK